MNRVFSLATSIPKTCVRRLSVTQAKCKDSAIAEIKKKQIQFQMEEGRPVYLKGGFADYILYYTTMILIAVGFGVSGSSIYKLDPNLLVKFFDDKPEKFYIDGILKQKKCTRKPRRVFVRPNTLIDVEIFDIFAPLVKAEK